MKYFNGEVGKKHGCIKSSTAGSVTFIYFMNKGTLRYRVDQLFFLLAQLGKVKGNKIKDRKWILDTTFATKDRVSDWCLMTLTVALPGSIAYIVPNASNSA